jgi:Heterokaryon incompatibility protein (HET)
MDPYIYKELTRPSSFRLLNVFRSESSNPLNCSLIECPLDDEIQYEALSYVWGDTQDRGSISCDGKEILVTRNCLDAIRYLRLPSHAGTLWIDAICIYSHRTATKHLGTMRFAPQFFEGFNFTHLASQLWQ